MSHVWNPSIGLACPSTEYSPEFIKGMLNRMAVSYHKYGAVADAYPEKVNALASLRERLRQYLATGNTEFLMDAANFAMIEYMHPSHDYAHYDPNSKSPGRATWTENTTEKSNEEIG